MKPIHLYIVTAIACTISLGCAKSSSSSNYTPPPVPAPLDTLMVATFVNESDTAITIDVYGSADDYAKSTNKITSVQLNNGASLPRTIKTFGTFYLDCYSSSYYYTNWFYSNFTNTSRPQSVLYEPAVNNGQAYTLRPDMSDVSTDRLILLNGNQPSTTWKVVNAYKNSGSTWVSAWGSISATAKNMTMVFNKNFVMNFTDTVGINNYCAFTHNGSDKTLYGDVALGSNHLGVFSNGNQSPPFSHSFDSLGFQYDNQDVRYIFAKQ